jgi:hypothetical protein
MRGIFAYQGLCLVAMRSGWDARAKFWRIPAELALWVFHSFPPGTASFKHFVKD